jgi:hypothetical protein
MSDVDDQAHGHGPVSDQAATLSTGRRRDGFPIVAE